MTEEEKLARMKYAESIAKEIHQSLRKRLIDENLSISDSLHVGVVLSSYIISIASRNSLNIPKEEILNQFIEALLEYSEIYEAVSLTLN